MFLPPCLSLVLALVPTAQEPTAPAIRPWVELPPGRVISTVAFSQGSLAVEVWGASTGRPIQTQFYGPDAAPDGGPGPPRIVPIKGPTRIVFGQGADIRKWIPKSESDETRTVVSDNLRSALVIVRPDSPGGTGEVTLYTLLDSEKRVESNTMDFSSFANAMLTSDGEFVYVQAEGLMQQWGWRDYLDGSSPATMPITGEPVYVVIPGHRRSANDYDYFLMRSPLAVEVFQALRPMPPGMKLPIDGGEVPLSVSLGVVPTRNYATYADMDEASGILVVAARERLTVQRLESDSKLHEVANYGPPEAGAEYRSCRFVPPTGTGAAETPMLVVVGLIRNVEAPSLSAKGSCQVAALVLSVGTTGAADPTVLLRTPWLDSNRWNGVSPGLHLSKDKRLLYVSTRGRVWRFEVPA